MIGQFAVGDRVKFRFLTVDAHGGRRAVSMEGEVKAVFTNDGYLMVLPDATGMRLAVLPEQCQKESP